MSGLEDEYGLSGSRPKLIYLKTPAPDREPRLATLIARIQRDDRVSYRLFSNPEELRSQVADDLAVLLTERFSASAPVAESSRRWPLPTLPRPSNPLIGRDADLGRILGLPAEPETRMLTLIGTGGVGKTRLALAVAEQARDRYADGVAYVEFAAVTEPSLVLPTLAAVPGVPEGPDGGIATGLRERLAGAQMLIVLDNMEQLAYAGGDISRLLSGASALQLLVTSRRILNVRGERVFIVEPLVHRHVW